MIHKSGCVLFVALLLAAIPVSGTNESEPAQRGDDSSLERLQGDGKPGGTIFKFEKINQNTLLQFKGSGASHSRADDNKGVFGLETLFGQLLFRDADTYDGFYFISGKIESDNRLRFNATFAYFPGFLEGETRFTYRFMQADVLDTLALDDEVKGLLDEQYSEQAIEQGFGFSYKRRFKALIKELAFDYAYTLLGSERFTSAPFDIDTQTAFRRVQADVGFGDIDTHDAIVSVAFGAERIDNPLLQGLRLDVQSGYQQADYSGLDSFDDVTDRGFSGGLELQTCTPYGLFKAGYQDTQVAKTSYGNYQLGGFDLSYRHMNYSYSEDETIIGITFTLSPFAPGSSLDGKCPRLFYVHDDSYDNVEQMAHISRLTLNNFIAKPRVRVMYTDLFRVDKAELPANVSLDSTTEADNPRIVVRTGCRQLGLLSATPGSAASAFAAGGNDIYVSLAELPSGQQSLSATFDDDCCGNTQVNLTTSAAATPAITSVRVEEAVGCVPEVEEPVVVEEPQVAEEPVPAATCVAANDPCNPLNNTCCFAMLCVDFSGGFGPPDYRCQIP